MECSGLSGGAGGVELPSDCLRSAAETMAS